MASSGKQKTTWAKIQRESVRREKRAEKAARKEARKNAPPEPTPTDADYQPEDGAAPDVEQLEQLEQPRAESI